MFWCLDQLFTQTAWWVIPIIWVPVASWFISGSVKAGLPCSHVAPLVFLGIFLWTLAEYLLHRFLFHVKTKSYWLDTSILHFYLINCTYIGFCYAENSSFLLVWCCCIRGNTLHYLMHGCHHKHPMDSLRLVFPPAAAVILAVPVSTFHHFMQEILFYEMIDQSARYLWWYCWNLGILYCSIPVVFRYNLW